MFDRARVRCSACHALVSYLLVWATGGCCPQCLELVDERPVADTPRP
jgi:hypothetical protein